MLDIQHKKQILMKHLSCVFSKGKQFVNEHYMIGNLIATRNSYISGVHKRFKLIS